jgi:hypothetical protein
MVSSDTVDIDVLNPIGCLQLFPSIFHYRITHSPVSLVLVSPLHAHLAQGTQKTIGTETLTAAFLFHSVSRNQATMMSACDCEVLGLRASGNGRTCVQHHCCGMLVVPNDNIKFYTTVIDGMGMGEGSKSVPEEAIKAVLIRNGTECCTVGFLCKSVVVVERDKARFVGALHRSYSCMMSLQTKQ